MGFDGQLFKSIVHQFGNNNIEAKIRQRLQISRD
ncbi:MAG: hypothetical protein ACOX6D_03115 [Thermoguttaceae bacterium]